MRTIINNSTLPLCLEGRIDSNNAAAVEAELLDVKKRLREISVEGCEKLGQGGNGAVYRLDEDKIVKVYKPWMGLDAIDRERSFARTAFVNGIPSVIAYDVVKVGDCLGVVFEMLKSDTLGLLYAMNVVLVVGSGSERAMKSAPMIMDKLLRGVVIPNERAIRALYRRM